MNGSVPCPGLDELVWSTLDPISFFQHTVRRRVRFSSRVRFCSAQPYSATCEGVVVQCLFRHLENPRKPLRAWLCALVQWLGEAGAIANLGFTAVDSSRVRKLVAAEGEAEAAALINALLDGYRIPMRRTGCGQTRLLTVEGVRMAAAAAAQQEGHCWRASASSYLCGSCRRMGAAWCDACEACGLCERDTACGHLSACEAVEPAWKPRGGQQVPMMRRLHQMASTAEEHRAVEHVAASALQSLVRRRRALASRQMHSGGEDQARPPFTQWRST